MSSQQLPLFRFTRMSLNTGPRRWPACTLDSMRAFYFIGHALTCFINHKFTAQNTEREAINPFASFTSGPDSECLCFVQPKGCRR